MIEVKLSAVKNFKGLNTVLMFKLFNGKKVASVTDEYDKRNLWVKVTKLIINHRFYYGFWEKDMSNDRWKLFNFGELSEVMPIWDEYIANGKKNGYIKDKIAE